MTIIGEKNIYPGLDALLACRREGIAFVDSDAHFTYVNAAYVAFMRDFFNLEARIGEKHQCVLSGRQDEWADDLYRRAKSFDL